MMHNAGLSMRFGATATIFAGEMVALDNATTVRRAERGDVPFGIALGNAREDGIRLEGPFWSRTKPRSKAT